MVHPPAEGAPWGWWSSSSTDDTRLRYVWGQRRPVAIRDGFAGKIGLRRRCFRFELSRNSSSLWSAMDSRSISITERGIFLTVPSRDVQSTQNWCGQENSDYLRYVVQLSFGSDYPSSPEAGRGPNSAEASPNWANIDPALVDIGPKLLELGPNLADPKSVLTKGLAERPHKPREDFVALRIAVPRSVSNFVATRLLSALFVSSTGPFRSAIN